MLERTVALSRGATPVRQYLLEMTLDLIIHSWDLAAAVGQDRALPAPLVEFGWAQVQKWGDVSASGYFAAPVAAPDDASPQDRMLVGDRPGPVLVAVALAGGRAVPEVPGFAERILACVAAIPPGRVMTYGDVAEFAGTRSARTVGRVLAADGGTVPWHRVLRADGSLADHLLGEQRQRLLAEGVRFRGDRVELGAARWDGR